MALASQLTHKILTNTALPYQTYTSPIDQSPQYVGGRNVQINSRSFCTMRPGFSDFLEPVPTTFNHLLRLFSWARWDSTYFIMAVDELPSGQMAVYKFQCNPSTTGPADQSFVRIVLEPDDPLHHLFPSGVPYSFTTANDYLFISNPSDCYKWSPDHGLQNWGIVAPATAPGVTVVAGGGLTTVNGGYSYVYTYVNSVTGHESSPSPLSAISPSAPGTSSTGNFNACDVNVTWAASPDPQVDRVNIYRTTDGGPRNPPQMALISQLPLPVGMLSATDSTPDYLLSAVQFAPPFYQNDPPPPMHSIITYAGRIWGVVGPRVWFSGQEEIANGVPQECFPGASIQSLAGNFYAYETEITALAPLTDGVAVFVPNRIQKIEGDSLDTFRRYTLLAKRGALIDYSVKVVGNSVLWFDRSKQVWLSDLGEIGRDIRPDLQLASLVTAQACIHIANQQHWICLLDPDNSLLYVYDLDINGWNVPWTVAATTIESIDVSLNVTRLAAAINGTHVMLENPNLYLDNGVPYDAWLITNSFSLAPESNPDFLATLDHIAVESNQYQPVDVAVKVDEDPLTFAETNPSSARPNAGFNALTTAIDPPRRTNGTYLIQKDYKGFPDQATPACRRLALRLSWRQPEPALWALYSIDFAMIPVGK